MCLEIPKHASTQKAVSSLSGNYLFVSFPKVILKSPRFSSLRFHGQGEGVWAPFLLVLCWFLTYFLSERDASLLWPWTPPSGQQSYPAGHRVYLGASLGALDPSQVVPLATITQEAQFLGHVFELLIKGGLGKTKRLCTLNPCSPTQSECTTVKQNKTKGWKTPLRMSKDRCLSQCQPLGLPYLSGRTGRGWRVSSHLSTPTGIHLEASVQGRPQRLSQVTDWGEAEPCRGRAWAKCATFPHPISHILGSHFASSSCFAQGPYYKAK